MSNYITRVSRDTEADRWLAECLACDWKRTYVRATTGSMKVYGHWRAEHLAAWIEENR